MHRHLTILILAALTAMNFGLGAAIGGVAIRNHQGAR